MSVLINLRLKPASNVDCNLIKMSLCEKSLSVTVITLPLHHNTVTEGVLLSITSTFPFLPFSHCYQIHKVRASLSILLTKIS